MSGWGFHVKPNLIETVRWLASVAAVTLASMETYYPNWHWIPVTLGSLAIVGIHVIPTNAQVMPPENPEVPKP